MCYCRLVDPQAYLLGRDLSTPRNILPSSKISDASLAWESSNQTKRSTGNWSFAQGIRMMCDLQLSEGIPGVPRRAGTYSFLLLTELLIWPPDLTKLLIWPPDLLSQCWTYLWENVHIMALRCHCLNWYCQEQWTKTNAVLIPNSTSNTRFIRSALCFHQIWMWTCKE